MCAAADCASADTDLGDAADSDRLINSEQKVEERLRHQRPNSVARNDCQVASGKEDTRYTKKGGITKRFIQPSFAKHKDTAHDDDYLFVTVVLLGQKDLEHLVCLGASKDTANQHPRTLEFARLHVYDSRFISFKSILLIRSFKSFLIKLTQPHLLTTLPYCSHSVPHSHWSCQPRIPMPMALRRPLLQISHIPEFSSRAPPPYRVP